MKFYANVSLNADDSQAAVDALAAIPGLIEVIDGPDPDDEEIGDEDEDVKD